MKYRRFFAMLLAYVLIFSLSVPVSAAELAAETLPTEETAKEFVEEFATDVSGNELPWTEAEPDENTEPVEVELPVYNAGTSMNAATMINFDEFYEESGSIGSSYNRYYSFTLEAAGRVTFDYTYDYIYEIYIYDSHGTIIADTGFLMFSPYANSWELDLTAGTYYIRFYIPQSSINYRFKATLVDSIKETVPENNGGQNNKLTSASAIATGSEVVGQIACNDETDFYKFTMAESGRAAINLSAEIQELSYYIYDDKGTKLTSKDAAWNQTTEVLTSNSYVDLVAGNYYIEIRQKNDYTGKYAFSLIPSSAGESFPESQAKNDNALKSANNITESVIYAGQLALNDDRDWYKISVGSNAKLIIDFNSSTMSAVNLAVYDVNGDEVMNYNPAAAAGLAVSNAVEIANGGVYYIGIIRYADSASYTGPYSFRASIHYHTYTTTTTRATLSSDGSIVTKCACGTIASQTVINRPWTISLSKETYTYDGRAKKPSVVVRDVYGNVISSANYTVSYASGRKNVGKYKVTVKFKGNYSGTKDLSFTINPQKTAIIKLTPSSKAFTVKYRKVSKQISGYQIQYSTKSSFKGAGIKTVSASKTSQKYKGLRAKKTYYVRVRTYKTVKGKKYYSDWSSIKRVTPKK